MSGCPATPSRWPTSRQRSLDWPQPSLQPRHWPPAILSVCMWVPPARSLKLCLTLPRALPQAVPDVDGVCVVQTLPALTAPLTCCNVRLIRAWSDRSARCTLPPKRSMRIGGLCPVAHRSWRLVCVSQGCTNIENQPLAFVSPVLVRLFSTSRTPAPRTQTHTPQLSWTGKCVELIQSPSYTPHPLLHHMHPWLSLRSPAREPGDSYPH